MLQRLQGDPPHIHIRRLYAKQRPERRPGLTDQHGKAVHHRQASRPPSRQERGHQGAVGHVHQDGFRPRQRQVDVRRDTQCIDDQRGFTQRPWLNHGPTDVSDETFGPGRGSVQHPDTGSGRKHGCHCRPGCAARAQDHHQTILDRKAGRLIGEGSHQTGAIGAVGADPAALEQQQIGRAAPSRRRGGFVCQGQRLLLERGRHVEPAQETGAPLSDELGKLRRVRRPERAIIGLQPRSRDPGPMDQGAERMGDRLACDTRLNPHDGSTPARRNSARTGHSGRPRTVK